MAFPSSDDPPVINAHIVKSLVWLTVWCFWGVAASFLCTLGSMAYKDWQANEITDWKYTIDVAWTATKPMALVAAVAYRQKYKALLKPPPGTGVEKRIETTIQAPGQPTIKATATETVQLVPKPSPDSSASDERSAGL